jgi:hypothetical protein
LEIAVRITISAFGGIAPVVSPRHLSEARAQVSRNTKAFSLLESLDAQRGFSAPVASLPGTIKSIYRFGDTISDTDYWFRFTSDVDVVRGFIAGDVSVRTFFTGLDRPRATDVTLALSGMNHPANSYWLGVPKPTDGVQADNITPEPDPDELAPNDLKETRVYTFTWVNSWDEESEPFSAPVMPGYSQVNARLDDTIRLTFPSVPTGAFNITKKRIYRSQKGTGISTFLFVAEIPAAQGTFDDTVPADSLAEECPSYTWEMPPEDLRGLVALANGILVGFTGHDIYLSEPYRPFAWPSAYHVSAGAPIVGLGTMDTTVAVLTNKRPFFLQGSHPSNMVLVESDIPQACVAKRSIVSMPGGVMYASPDGLVQLSAGGSGVVTQGLFSHQQWKEMIKPETIHAYVHDMQYIAFHEGGCFVFDVQTGEFRQHDLTAVAGHADLSTDTLYLFDGANVRKWDGGDKLTYRWKSKQFTPPYPAGFTCLRVEADAYPVTIRVFRDGAQIIEHVVTDSKIRRIPAGRGRMWELELEGTSRVFRVHLAESPTEIQYG